MSDRDLKIAVLGAGRMGQQIVHAIDVAPDCRVAGVWSRTTSTELTTLLCAANVAIDFTLPGVTTEVVRVATEQKIPLVCGVTGVDDAAQEAIVAAAIHIPILYDRNMSQGIAIVSNLLRKVAGILGPEWKPGIVETHHIHKKDAPSGTAIALREALGDDSIEIESRREGEVVGDHRVRFSSSSESIEIAHSVADRRVFADGALAAARWLIHKPPGLYRMTDIWT
jgi:4-hydroxy-tetrahydrodipicolinate reductase